MEGKGKAMKEIAHAQSDGGVFGVAGQNLASLKRLKEAVELELQGSLHRVDCRDCYFDQEEIARTSFCSG